jgi:hypothetical protein
LFPFLFGGFDGGIKLSSFSSHAQDF